LILGDHLGLVAKFCPSRLLSFLLNLLGLFLLNLLGHAVGPGGYRQACNTGESHSAEFEPPRMFGRRWYPRSVG
jgi:hypothetical protein